MIACHFNLLPVSDVTADTTVNLASHDDVINGCWPITSLC